MQGSNKKIEIKPTDTVLDYGCAKGLMVQDFVEKGYNFHGYDISKYAVMNAY